MTDRIWRDGRPLYFLFAYVDYYPEGGIRDYVATFDSIEEAERYVNGNTGDEIRWHDHLDLLKLAIDGGLVHAGEFEREADRPTFRLTFIAGPSAAMGSRRELHNPNLDI